MFKKWKGEKKSEKGKVKQIKFKMRREVTKKKALSEIKINPDGLKNLNIKYKTIKNAGKY